MSGSQLRYSVYAGDKLVALLSFGASAWRLAGRDKFIGRIRNLALLTTSCRFLSRCGSCQPINLSRPASRQALAPS